MPSVATHISGKAIALAIEENMGWQNYKIVQDNANVFEQAQTQKLMNQAAEDIQVASTVSLDGQQPMGEEPPIDTQQ